jgi:epoxyqueuosine reductase
MDKSALLAKIRDKGRALGFADLGIAAAELGEDQVHLNDWLSKGQHGQMHYMAAHGAMRSTPELLQPGTLSVISVRMNYAADDQQAWDTLAQPDKAYVARYALGRDYHKTMRQRLKQLAQYIESEIGAFGYRVLVDSAPALERALARNAELGWIGKHTCLIDKNTGSWFFLGEIYTDLPLDGSANRHEGHCGTCTRCIDICPTQAIIAPYRLDARRCISYLTIEHHGSIPEEFRTAIGNRIFGCDDCQLVCPWNKFAKRHDEPDFKVRNNLDNASLLDLFAWSEQEFLERTEGSAIRRTGYTNWLRNIAIAIGNAEASPEHLAALREKMHHADDVVREHAMWAYGQLQGRLNPPACAAIIPE